MLPHPKRKLSRGCQDYRRAHKVNVSPQARILVVIGAIGVVLLVGCHATPSSQSTVTPLPVPAITETAVLGAKLTAIAEATAYPATPLPPEEYPTVIVAWTPAANEIVADDSGNTYEIWITSRVAIILDRTVYPPENLTETCTQEGVLGRVSNLPEVPPPYYAVRYEGVKVGECLIRDGSFQVTIKVAEHP